MQEPVQVSELTVMSTREPSEGRSVKKKKKKTGRNSFKEGAVKCLCMGVINSSRPDAGFPRAGWPGTRWQRTSFAIVIGMRKV